MQIPTLTSFRLVFASGSPRPFVAVAALTASLALAGCGVMRTVPASSSSTAAVLHGTVHGGQQPVAGSTIQLWAAGTTGNASQATPLLTSAVLTDAGGSFDITNDYTCPTASTQVYLTASGGNPGLGGTVDNSSLALAVALGDCGVLPSTPSVSINELTTVAAAWALAPFASAIDHVGASSTNQTGLSNAMSVATLLADSQTGRAPGAALPANATTETAKLITLADLLANCVNSDGTSVCASLFADASVSATAPTNTFEAALTIAQNPTHAVLTLFNDTPAIVPFGGALSQVPSDWTISLSYTGGGLSNPNTVALDASGGVWVSSAAGTISAFYPQGMWLWEHGISGAGLAATSSLAIDGSRNVWAASPANGSSPNTDGSVATISPSGFILSQPYGYVSGLYAPVAVASAPNGTVWVGNSDHSVVSLLDASGNALSGTNGFGGASLHRPAALAVANDSSVWIASVQGGNVTNIAQDGTILGNAFCCTTPDSIALDSLGSLWVGDSAQSTLTQLNAAGILLNTISDSRLNAPRSIAVDGAGRLFVTNSGSGSLALLADSTSSQPGSFLTAAAGLGADAQLNQPYGAAIDASGSVWVTSSGDNRLVRFVGLAAPVRTPASGLPQQP